MTVVRSISLWRRHAARALAIGLGLCLTVPVAAQDKPMIRMLVGFPPGAGTDTLARIYAEALGERLNANVIVENRPGAGGQIAAQALKAATPDSNTLMFTVDHQVVMVPLVTRNPGFDVRKDLQPVARISNFYVCLAVPANSPARDYAGYIDLARKTPEQGNFGIPAPGSQAQFVGFVLAQHHKVPLNPVAYRGAAPAIQDLLGAQVPSAIVPCDALLEHAKAGKVRVLAMAANKRVSTFPDVPTFAELGVAMPADSFLGVYAPATARPELMRQVAEATRAMFETPRFVARVAGTGMEPAYANAQDLAGIVQRNVDFWSEQVRLSNFQLQ